MATNAVELLKTDHEKVKKLFKQFQDAGENAHKTKERLADEILNEMEAHSKIEEEIFYPAYRNKADKEGQATIAEGYEEHAIVDRLVLELRSMPKDGEEFEAKMKVLIENVEHHIEEEEEEMLPEAEEALKDQLDTLGEEMQTRKESILAELGASS